MRDFNLSLSKQHGLRHNRNARYTRPPKHNKHWSRLSSKRSVNSCAFTKSCWWIIYSSPWKPPVIAGVFECVEQVRASSSLWEVELWPQSDQHSAGTSLQSGLFELKIFSSVKNYSCVWNAVTVLLNSLLRPMYSSCSVGVPGKVYGAVAGAAPGVLAERVGERDGESSQPFPLIWTFRNSLFFFTHLRTTKVSVTSEGSQRVVTKWSIGLTD